VLEAYDSADMGRAVRALRHERHWTQEELASWLGVVRQTVVSLEHGGPVSLDVAMRALAMLGAKAMIVPKSYGLGNDR
jgi:DNA-binding XRE family transcriptional regulator